MGYVKAEGTGLQAEGNEVEIIILPVKHGKTFQIDVIDLGPASHNPIFVYIFVIMCAMCLIVFYGTGAVAFVCFVG